MIDKPTLENKAWYRILKTLHSLAIIISIAIFLLAEGLYVSDYIKYHSNTVLSANQIDQLKNKGYSDFQIKYDAPSIGYSMPVTSEEISEFLLPIPIFIAAIMIFKIISDALVYIISGKDKEVSKSYTES